MPNPTPSKNNPAFTRLITNPLLFRLYLLTRLPSAFFAGLKIPHLDTDTCTVTVPYKWFTRNPFKSTYFACLAMAAEMSTGALVMNLLYKHDPPVSMLVVGAEATFHKKATGITRFTCADGPAIQSAVQAAVTTGEGQAVRTRSTGTNANGDLVAEFYITWSFKVKSK